jgi:alpha,alpha-trehalase
MIDLFQEWQKLDADIQTWWEGDLHTAQEEDIRNDPQKTLIFLPFPYSSAGGSESAFPEMYGWYTFFINLGMLAHKRPELVRNHILNHLSMIERFGMVLNGNRTYYLTRSQPPLLAESVYRYGNDTLDRDLLSKAYPLLQKEYEGYWNAPHHETPIGLATNCDLGDKGLRPELSSEAETGLDFTACFGGDIRQCVPLLTNCALVRYAHSISWIAEQLDWNDISERWKMEAERRAELMRRYCWNKEEGFFFEYNYVRKEQIKVRSLCAYWTLWADVATQEQAKRLVGHLPLFEKEFGLSFTPEIYPSPHAEFSWLQWGCPSGWPPMHIIVCEGLDRAGYSNHAERIAEKFLSLMIRIYNETGKLWEKYNVAEGSIEFPHERYKVMPLHGWSSAAAAILGRRLFQ